MKRAFLILVTIVAAIWLGLQIFGRYEKKNLLSNEIAFDIRVELDSVNVDKFFDLSEGTFDETKHVIICKLPLRDDPYGFPQNYELVKFGTDDLNCDEEYQPGKYIKHQTSQLEGESGELLLVNNRNAVSSGMFNEELYSGAILSRQQVDIKYRKGKVNRLVFSLYGMRDFCR